MSAIDRDAVRIARVEVGDLDHPNPEVRRVALATLAQAVHAMRNADPESRNRCARLTHHNGQLNERYQPGQVFRWGVGVHADQEGAGMSTVDQAIEAGARALSAHWHDMHTGGSLDRQRALAEHSTRAVWPVLSAGLRELHAPFMYDVEWCSHCADDNDREYNAPYPCETVRELDRIDRELGIETDNQSGDLS